MRSLNNRVHSIVLTSSYHRSQVMHLVLIDDSIFDQAYKSAASFICRSNLHRSSLFIRSPSVSLNFTLSSIVNPELVFYFDITNVPVNIVIRVNNELTSCILLHPVLSDCCVILWVVSVQELHWTGIITQHFVISKATVIVSPCA